MLYITSDKWPFQALRGETSLGAKGQGCTVWSRHSYLPRDGKVLVLGRCLVGAVHCYIASRIFVWTDYEVFLV
jgi:hypothetical protein